MKWKDLFDTDIRVGERLAALGTKRPHRPRAGTQREDAGAAGTAAGSLLRPDQSAVSLAAPAGSGMHRHGRTEPPPLAGMERIL